MGDWFQLFSASGDQSCLKLMKLSSKSQKNRVSANCSSLKSVFSIRLRLKSLSFQTFEERDLLIEPLDNGEAASKLYSTVETILRSLAADTICERIQSEKKLTKVFPLTFDRKQYQGQAIVNTEG